LELAGTVLSRPSTGDSAAELAAAAGAAAGGLLGRLDEAMRLRRLGLAAAARDPDASPWARTRVEYGACAALLLCGEVRRAE
jgi:hypothetical protein